jgi:hypothetical protein
MALYIKPTYKSISKNVLINNEVEFTTAVLSAAAAILVTLRDLVIVRTNVEEISDQKGPMASRIAGIGQVPTQNKTVAHSLGGCLRSDTTEPRRDEQKHHKGIALRLHPSAVMLLRQWLMKTAQATQLQSLLTSVRWQVGLSPGARAHLGCRIPVPTAT